MSLFSKKLGVGMMLAFFCLSVFAPPIQSKAEPVSIILAIVGIVGTVTVVDAVSCDVNIIFGCDGGGGGGGGGGGDGGGGGGGDPTPGSETCTSTANGCGMTTDGVLEGGVCSAVTPPDNTCPACTSSPNGCGMTNPGNVLGGSCNAVTPPNTSCPVCTSTPNACGQTNTGNILGGVCSATTPPNSSCPPPTFGINSFSATPSTLGVGVSATLTWSVTNATECSITSDTGFSSLSGPIAGSISTGPILVTTTYTLTCENGNGGPKGSKTIKVIVDPHFKEL